MKTTASISKEELLNKIEMTKKLLDDVTHYDRRYLIDDVLLDKLFDLAYNSIPIEWLKLKIDTLLNIYPDGNEETEVLCKLLYEWEKRK